MSSKSDDNNGQSFEEEFREACEVLQESDNPTAQKLGDGLLQALSESEEARS